MMLSRQFWFFVRELRALLRGRLTRKAAIRRSSTFWPMLEFLEFRGDPSDMAGNMPAFAMAAFFFQWTGYYRKPNREITVL
jgi:hypothetical protein